SSAASSGVAASARSTNASASAKRPPTLWASTAARSSLRAPVGAPAAIIALLCIRSLRELHTSCERQLHIDLFRDREQRQYRAVAEHVLRAAIEIAGVKQRRIHAPAAIAEFPDDGDQRCERRVVFRIDE